jgi:hypothetical protein
MPNMQKPHLPTLMTTVIILVVALVLYHFTLGRKK